MPSGHWYSLVGHLMGRDGEEWEGGIEGVGRRDKWKIIWSGEKEKVE